MAQPQPQPLSKAQLLHQRVERLLGWFVDEKFVDVSTVKAAVEKYKLNENDGIKMVAGYLENFFLKAKRSKQLRPYIEKQVKEGQLLILRMVANNNPDVPMTDLRFRHFSPEQIDALTTHVDGMLNVLLAQ
jgi:hypothetical protein